MFQLYVIAPSITLVRYVSRVGHVHSLIVRMCREAKRKKRSGHTRIRRADEKTTKP